MLHFIKMDWRQKSACLAMGLITAVLLGVSGISQSMDFQAVNLLFRKLGTRFQPSPDIVIVTIDDAALQAYEPQWGRWPWPRQALGRLVDACEGASSVGLDILLLEGDRHGLNSDEELGKALQRHGRVALAGTFVSEMVKAPSPTTSSSLDKSMIPITDSQSKFQRLLDQFILPIPSLAQKTDRIGHVNYFPSPDGLLREYPYFVSTEKSLIPSLATAVGMAEGSHQTLQEWLTHQRGLRPDAHIRELLFYNRPFTRYSALDLLNGNPSFPPPHWARGKMIFIGVEAEGLQDLRPTPSSGVMTGLNIHATALSNLLQQKWLVSFPPWLVFLFSLVMSILPLLLWELSVRRTLFYWVTIPSLYLVGGCLLFHGFAIRTPWSQPLLAFAVAGTCRTFFWVNRERSLRKKLEALESMKRSLGNMLVHDLKSPLNSMLMLLESIPSLPPADSRRETRMKNALQEGRRLNQLILSLLEIQRMESKRLELKLSTFSWGELIDENVRRLEPGLAARHLSVLQIPEDQPLQVTGDRPLLQRVIQNILENAISHATPHTPIRCENLLKEGPPRQWAFRIANQGPSLDPSLHDTLFDAYTKGSTHPLEDQHQKFGLGLAFCKLAVLAHGGNIRCISPLPGSPDGFAIEITLPVPASSSSTP